MRNKMKVLAIFVVFFFFFFFFFFVYFSFLLQFGIIVLSSIPH